jgi:hypothetical protein
MIARGEMPFSVVQSRSRDQAHTRPPPGNSRQLSLSRHLGSGPQISARSLGSRILNWAKPGQDQMTSPGVLRVGQ